MARVGFIHDKLDIKFLVLYIMSRVVSPIDMPTLTDLTMCDEGVDYFAFAEAVHELVDTEHLVLKDDLYSITEKGRRNSEICQSSLPYSVRMHCDENLVKVNEALRREAQVQTQIQPNEDSTYTLHLYFCDAGGPLLDLRLLVPNQVQAAAMAARFQSDPSSIYHAIAGLLSRPADKEDSHEAI